MSRDLHVTNARAIMNQRSATAELLPGTGQEGGRHYILRAWTLNHPQVVGTCPGHQHQPIGQNQVFKIERPEQTVKSKYSLVITLAVIKQKNGIS